MAQSFCVQRKEADAMAVDGGQVYSAGKCGLVVAMVEEYNNECEQNHVGKLQKICIKNHVI